jgi:hypothetical protein
MAILVLNTTYADDIQLVKTINLGYTPNQVKIWDHELYVGRGYEGISVYNITDGSDPVLLDSYQPDFSIDRFDVDDRFIYTVGSYSGIGVINRTDPSSLNNISYIEKTAILEDVQVAGEQLFVANRLSGIESYSIMDNGSVEYQSTFSFTQVRDLDLIDDNLVAVDAYSVSIYEIGTASLVETATASIDSILSNLQITTQVFDPESVHIDNNTIYVSQGYNGIGIYTVGVESPTSSTTSTMSNTTSDTATSTSSTTSTESDNGEDSSAGIIPVSLFGIIGAMITLPIIVKYRRN